MTSSRSGGCCTDCENDRTSCDESCIRIIAAAQCRSSEAHVTPTAPDTDNDCAEPCCAEKTSDPCERKTFAGCCGADQCDGLISSVESQKLDCCDSAPIAGRSQADKYHSTATKACTGSGVERSLQPKGCCANPSVLGDTSKKRSSCSERGPTVSKSDSCAAEIVDSNGCLGDACCNDKSTKANAKSNNCNGGSSCNDKSTKADAKSDNCDSGCGCAEDNTSSPTDLLSGDNCNKGCCRDEEACCGESSAETANESDGSNTAGCCAGDESAVSKNDRDATGGAECDGEGNSRCARDQADADAKNDCYSNEKVDTRRDDPCDESDFNACETHLRRAFDEYSKYLQQGLCICKSVLNRLDGCCGKPRSTPASLTVSSDCCGSSTAIATRSASGLRRTTKKSCSKVCCTAGAAGDVKTLSQEVSCSLDDIRISSTIPAKSNPSKLRTIDIEEDAARQHVVLNVSGMTCTGCVRKVTNILHTMDGVSAVNVTFVTGIAEFDLDQETAKLEDVLPRIQKETGFKFSQIVSTFQSLDLLVDPSVARQALERLKDLCESVEKVNKTTYRVSYDPTSVGARTILSSASGIRLAPPGTDSKLADGRRNLIRKTWATSLAAVFTIPVVVLAWSNVPVSSLTSSIIELVLGTFVQAIAVPEFYVGALKSLIYSRVLEMDMLVVISITAAYGYSIVAFALTCAGYTLQEKAFFETSSLLITLVLLGRLIAAIAKLRAVSAVSVRSLQAEKALLSDPSAGGTVEIDARLLQLGDVFVVPAHSTVTTDGEITSGASAVDESMLTGESIPVPKAIGDHLIAGTTNGPGTLTVRLTRLPGKNSITDIAGMVENALASKPRIQDLADRIAACFIPGVITISLLVFAIWIAVALRVRGDNGGGAVGLSITYAIAVLAVSCPCALGLAVPMVLVIAGGIAARQGVIIKQADAIERGYKVTDIVFDKTGTITTGDLEVVNSQVFSDSGYEDEEINSITTALILDNQHPVSLAVAAYLRKKIHGKSCCVENLESIPGSGIQGTWNGHVVRAGNPFWLGVEHRPEIAEMLGQGMTVLCITVDATPLTAFGLTSSLRPEAINVIADLHRRGFMCHILSGDSSRAVGDVAQAVGIPPSNVASRHSPAQKQHYVQQLMDSGKIVLFCGDGTNDAVAVAQANVGVQIGTASAVTRGTADVVLLGGLDGLLALLDLSKRSFHRITFNFVWAAVYNLFAILLAGGAFVKARIPPAYAGLGEIVSVVPVILAALTLARNHNRHSHAVNNLE